jgi:hypothetical protein
MTTPGYQKIGTVDNVDGTTVTVGVNDDMVVTDGPLQLLSDQQEEFGRLFVAAVWKAGQYDGQNQGEDGGDDG